MKLNDASFFGCVCFESIQSVGYCCPSEYLQVLQLGCFPRGPQHKYLTDRGFVLSHWVIIYLSDYYKHLTPGLTQVVKQTLPTRTQINLIQGWKCGSVVVCVYVCFACVCQSLSSIIHSLSQMRLELCQIRKIQTSRQISHSLLIYFNPVLLFAKFCLKLLNNKAKNAHKVISLLFSLPFLCS